MAAPLLLQSLPADNATGVSVATNLGLGFDQAIKAGSGFIRIYKADGTLFHTISVTDTAQVIFSAAQPARVTINPNVDLVAGTGYYILVDAGAIENLGGEDYAGISSSTALNFTTAGSPPGDTVAPLLNTTTPADNATGVAVGSNLVLTFNEAVKAGSGNIEIHKVSDGTIAKTIAISDGTQVTFSGNQLTINPTTDLAAGTGYYVTFASGVVRDLANNNFAGVSSSTALNFTTAAADSVAPLLVSTTPLDNATGVAVGMNLILTFNEAVQPGFGSIVIRNVVGGTVAQVISVTDTSQVSFSGSQMIINPTTDLAENHAYYVTFSSGVVRDLANNAFAGISSSTTFNFTTAGSADTTAPILLSSTPTDGATNVGLETDIVLTFNEAVQPGYGYLYLYKGLIGLQEVIPIWDTDHVIIAGGQVTIDPQVDLEDGFNYYVLIDSTALYDAAGNYFGGISSPTTLNFATPPDTLAPLLIDTLPADDADDVAPDANIVLYFDDLVKAGSGNVEIHNAADGSLVESISIADTSRVFIYANSVVIQPDAVFQPGETYYVTLGSGVVLDKGNNAFAGISSSTTFNFTGDPDELLIGTRFSDTLDGEAGDDTLDGHTGFDTLIGGPGDDTFIIANFEGGETSIVMEAEEGFYIPNGPIFSLNNPEYFYYYLSENTNGDVDWLYFAYSDPNLGGRSASIRISTEQLGTGLTAGTYLDVDPTLIASPGHAGLDVTVGSAGFGTPSGSSFTINEITFDYSGETPVLLSLSVSIELGESLFGTFNYNYASAGPATPDMIVEDANEGTDTVYSEVSYVLGPNLENLVLMGGGDIAGTGNALANVITGNGSANFIDGKAGADTMIGGYSDDTYVVDNAGDSIVEIDDWFSGVDTVQSSITRTLEANVENLTLTGNNATNGTGNNLDNTFTGNSAANVFSGGTGNDIYNLGTGDTVLENSTAGTDTVQSSISQTLAANVENLTLTGTSNINGTGNGLDNVLIGSQQLPGGGGQNVLTGGGGNDTLDGRSGLDTLIGGLGNDTYIIDNYEGGQNSILLQSTPGDYIGMGWTFSYLTDPTNLFFYTGDGTGDGIVDAISFAYHDPEYSHWWYLTFSTTQLGTNLVPGTYTDAERAPFASPGHPGLDISGDGRGSNVLSGSFTITQAIFDYSGGSPVLVSLSISFEQHSEGPSASPLYGVINYNYAPAGPAVLDTVVENSNEGVDTVQSGVNYTLGPNVENLVLKIGSDDLNGTGNALNNSLTGNDGDNVLDGGAGADTMAGYWGDDTYIVDNAGDQVVDAYGNDTIKSSISRTLDANVENLILTGSGNINGTGNELSNTLTGTSGANLLTGGLGDDTYIFESGDTIVENPGEGLDTVKSAVTHTLENNVEILWLTGSANINGTGNSLANTFIGNDGANVFSGGSGDDQYFMYSAADSIVENFNEGVDLVIAYINYTLDANVENLKLKGETTYEWLNGTGNSLDNDITGNSGVNIIDGGAGADTMVGGGADDTYVVDNPGDVAFENEAYLGTDTVLSSISRLLDLNIEILTLTGSANIDGTGNDLNNAINGNTGNNVLAGGLGLDTLAGGGGNDTFKVLAGTGSDVVVDFTAGAGTGDTALLDGFALGSFSAVQAAMTQNGNNTILNLGNGQTLTFLNVAKASFAADDFTFVNVQAPTSPSPFTLPLSGAFTNTISGTRRADNLNGTAANNRFDGKQGNDTMTGLAGDDTYLVDASGDVVVETGGNGIDTVISSASSYTLASNVENLTLTGTNNHTATGNGLNNLIIASSRPDTINGGVGNDIIQAGTGACMLTGGDGNDIFAFPVAGSLKTVADFEVGEDLVDLRSLLAWYGGTNPVGDGVISVTATAGGVLVSVKATAGGSLQSLVKLTGIAVGDVDVGGDILWDA